MLYELANIMRNFRTLLTAVSWFGAQTSGP